MTIPGRPVVRDLQSIVDSTSRQKAFGDSLIGEAAASGSSLARPTRAEYGDE
jgi:hypothetical protein